MKQIVFKHSFSEFFPPLTSDNEDAVGQHVPLDVSHGVVALVDLRHSLGHPDLPAVQQPASPSVARLGVRLVPQHNGQSLRRSTTRGKLQQGAVFRDAVLKAFPVVSVVGPNAF